MLDQLDNNWIIELYPLPFAKIAVGGFAIEEILARARLLPYTAWHQSPSHTSWRKCIVAHFKEGQYQWMPPPLFLQDNQRVIINIRPFDFHITTERHEEICILHAPLPPFLVQLA